MQVSLGGGVENPTGSRRRFARRLGPDGPHDDIQLGRERRGESLVLFERPVKNQRRLAARFEPPGKCTADFERQQPHRRPECHGRGPRPRALQRDLAQVQLGRAEVGIGRVMPIEPADGRVAEQDASATIGLEAVLVRVDDDRVRLANPVERRPGLGTEVARQGEIPAVRGVDVDAEIVPLAQGQDLGERVHRPGGRRAERHHDRTDLAAGEHFLQGRDLHPPPGIDGDLPEGDAEDRREPRVRVMGQRRGRHRPAGTQLTPDPEGLEIGHRPAAAEVAEVGLPAEHPRDPGHRLLLHRRAGATAVERMVIRVQEHRHRIGQSGHGMRRLEHLSDIERVMIGVVVPHPLRRFRQDIADRADVESGVEPSGRRANPSSSDLSISPRSATLSWSNVMDRPFRSRCSDRRALQRLQHLAAALAARNARRSRIRSRIPHGDVSWPIEMGEISRPGGTT